MKVLFLCFPSKKEIGMQVVYLGNNERKPKRRDKRKEYYRKNGKAKQVNY
jgi:hypothetical protein